MSIDTGPPAQPPQLSPDGNWVWDGSQWQPVTGGGAAPAHAGVFKAYDAIVVEPVAPTIDAAPPEVQYEQQYPLPVPTQDYSYGGSQPDLTPLWQQTKGGGYGRYLYFVAAIALFVMVLIVLSSMNFVQLPFIAAGSKSTPNPVAVQPSPTPDTSGPDSVRADRFMTGQLRPAFTVFDGTLPEIDRYCTTGNLSSACFDALTATETQVKNVAAVIAKADIPSCISVGSAKLQADVKGMNDQLVSALSGFPDNNKYTVQSGVRGFRNYLGLATTDYTATETAQKKCFTVVLPTWVPY
jgi:hypothetical protein